MSQISSTSLLGSSSSATTSTGKNKFSELSSEEFVKIMFTELSNQDPLKPNDSNQLLEQMSNLRSIQSNIDLQTKLSDVVSQNQLSTAGALLGKKVRGITEEGEPVEGVVKSVSQTKDGPVFNLPNGIRLPFKQVSEMLDSTPAATTAPATGV